jgi:DNA-binding MarR family transcriptional regulator
MLKVEERHVRMAECLLLELLERWGVDDYIEFAGAKPLSDEDLNNLKAWASSKELAKSVLHELSSHRWQGRDLAERIGYDYGSLRNLMSEFKGRELIVRRSDGYDLTKKGAALAKDLLLSRGKDSAANSNLEEQTALALQVLRHTVNELNGDNPLKVEYLDKLRGRGISDPEGLVGLLMRDSRIYEPKPGQVRPTTL